jgi:hypothetical protein
MKKNIVYEFLRDLGKDDVSYFGKIIECFENKRKGVWDQYTFEAVKRGLKLWWDSRYDFYVYLRVLGGALWAA